MSSNTPARGRAPRGARPTAPTPALQLRFDEQRSQPVAAQPDGTDDAPIHLTDEGVALAHARDLVRGEVGDDQIDDLGRIVVTI